jgi:carboxypeptidase T
MTIRTLLVCLLLCVPAEARMLTYTAFRTPAQLDAAFASLAAANPSLTTWTSIGNSLGGTPIKALKISSTPGVDDPAKGDVVFVGLHHAREWMAPETALFLADELLTLRATDAELRADMDRLQIWIVPVVNPDGYVYSATTDRYWRKNRRLNADGTRGVDLNRNWGFQWGLLSGSSSTPSHDTYHGTGAFSEPETVVIGNFLNARHNLKFFVTYHSYSEFYLVPWSYTTSPTPGDPTLHAVNDRNIARVASVHGHSYTDTIGYTSSGEATDWVWEQYRVYAVTPELRPAAGSPSCLSSPLSCFSPPATEILPNAEENFAAARALVHDAARSGLWIKDHPGDAGAEPSAVWTGSGWSNAFWISPDITTTPAGPLVGGSTVTLNVTVHNDTGATQNNVTVDAYYTDPRISLEFPNPNNVLIGTRTQNIAPGDTAITMPWTIPVGPNSWGEFHWCVGVVIKHDRDMPLSTHIQKSSNVGGKNFQTQPMLITQNLIAAIDNPFDVPGEMIVTADQAGLPAGWRVIVATPGVAAETAKLNLPLTSTARKARLIGVVNPVLEPGQTMYVPIRVVAPPGTPPGTQVDVHVHGAVSPLVPGKREAVGNGFTWRVVAP